MIEYNLSDRKYLLSYQHLREQYLTFVALSDKEFKKRLPEALHLACVICFLKEIPTYVCLADIGIIHELAHEIHIKDENTTPFKDIRKLFKSQLLLS